MYQCVIITIRFSANDPCTYGRSINTASDPDSQIHPFIKSYRDIQQDKHITEDYWYLHIAICFYRSIMQNLGITIILRPSIILPFQWHGLKPITFIPSQQSPLEKAA